ncbi:MAG: retroviral-like aspartic protease family protein [Deltaproteobacteria bacterium]|nr:retroviral-like aspartic protease family protein [Deltaproteobacteria bacterium]
MQNVTVFDQSARYIFLPLLITGKNGEPFEFDAILDTGAPKTEFSDQALQRAGFLEKADNEVTLTPGLSTQKYGQMIIPHLEVCSQQMKDLHVYVSHFEKSWGIDALIGLDFFRRFKVTVNYCSPLPLPEKLPGKDKI